MNKIFILILIISCFGFSANFQNLSLKECIRLAQDKSSPGIAVKNRFEARKNNYQSFKSGLLPQLSLNMNAPSLFRSIDEIPQPDGSNVFRSRYVISSNASLNLSQVIVPTNTRITLSSGINRLDNFEPVESLLWQTTPIQLSVSQQIFAFNGLKWENKIQDKQIEFFDKRYIEDMENIAIEVTQKFFNLYSQKISLENAKRNLLINDTLFTISQGRYSIGKIAENDLLQAELAYMNSQNAVETLELDYDRSISDLKIYLGLSPEDSLSIAPQLDTSPIIVDTDFAYNKALENRSEFDNFEIRELQAERDMKAAQINNSLNASIGASFGLNQSAGTAADAYQGLLDQETFNINLSIPIFQWGRYKYDYEAALASQRETVENITLEKKNYELTVKYEVNRFNLLAKQLEISEKSRDVAERRFLVAKNRFLIGKIDINTFYIAQNEKNRAIEQYIANLRDYWRAFYNLRLLTHWDFEKERLIEYN